MRNFFCVLDLSLVSDIKENKLYSRLETRVSRSVLA